MVRAVPGKEVPSVPFDIRARVLRAMRWSALVVVPIIAIPAAMSGVSTQAPPRTVTALAVAVKTPAPATGNAKTACIYTHNSISKMVQIGTRIGRPFQCASVYDSNSTWQDWENPWFAHAQIHDNQWAQWVEANPRVRRLIIGLSMIPNSVISADWRSRGATGAYDGYIRTLGRNLVQTGLGSSVIRLGFEANGNWNVDNVGKTNSDFAHWRAYWARFVRVMRSVPGAHFTFDWNLNSAYRNIPLAEIYPGDSVVDVIGVDVYDTAGPRLPAAPSPARWAAIARQPDGVAAILAFAHRHHKPFSVPEWGLISSPGGGGGDDSTFVAAIAALMRNNMVAFETYFDRPSVGGTLAIQNSRHSFAAYAHDFGRASEFGVNTARRS